MGVVYKARDTHLDRSVAIKVLPPEKTVNRERKRRFVQEAKAASALNHPNIVVIHDIAEEGGTDFMVMEYVAGKTLDELIPRHGIRLSEALRYAVQIADALTKAHGAGIIHRDMKPGNVMVDEDGRVKVLDFGLAKLMEMNVASDEDPTMTVAAAEAPHTRDGLVMGTAAYMSPEQAQGKKVDARSDIFSFGAMLYEMLTGKRPFRGDTTMSTMAAVINQEPEALAELPHDVGRTVRRCLRKDPARRFQTMADLKVALEELEEDSESGALAAAASAPPAKQRRGVLAVGASVIAVGIAAFVFWSSRETGPATDREYTPERLTTLVGVEKSLTLSPDGSQVAFAWNGENQDNFDIYVQMIGSGAPLRLTSHASADVSPAWSPDGRAIAFVRQLPNDKIGIYLIPPLGGPERKVCEADGTRSFWGSEHFQVSWSPDSRWLVLSDRETANQPRALYLVSIETGEKRKLTSPPDYGGDDFASVFSPDGRTLAFSRLRHGLMVLGLDEGLSPAGAPRRITDCPSGLASGMVWTPDGTELIVSCRSNSARSLYRVKADGSAPATQLGFTTGAGSGVALSARAGANGGRLVFSRRSTDANIYRLDLNGEGQKARRIASSTRNDVNPQFSPDGTRMTFASLRTGNFEIWVSDADGSNAMQLSFCKSGMCGTPRWSPDGKWVVFDGRLDGEPDIYLVSSDGGPARRVTTHPAENVIPSWSVDGNWIYFTSRRSGDYQIWKIPAAGGDAVQVTQGGGFAAFESPDGDFAYYTKAQKVKTSLWKVPVSGGPETEVISAVSARNFSVSRSGIWYMRDLETGGAEIRFFDFATGETSTVHETDWLPRFGLSVSSDGKSILFDQEDQTSADLMMVDGFR